MSSSEAMTPVTTPDPRAIFDVLVEDERLVTLRGPRVHLRWLEAADAPALFELFSSPEVCRYLPWTAYEDVTRAEALVERVHASFRMRELFQWGVARNDDGAVVGTGTLLHLDLTNGHAEVGFALRRDAWGQGLMSEAVTLLLDLAFERLCLRRMEADADPRNGRSVRLLERLGFQREGLLRERWRVAGEIQDSLILGLLAREWRARKA